MDPLIVILGPALVCSIALQQLLELLDPALDAFIKPHKKWILSAVALVFALLVTFGIDLRLLRPMGYPAPALVDGLLTALFIISGTKGANDLLKWIGYRKTAARLALPEAEARTV
jgi:hypothetical protein